MKTTGAIVVIFVAFFLTSCSSLRPSAPRIPSSPVAAQPSTPASELLSPVALDGAQQPQAAPTSPKPTDKDSKTPILPNLAGKLSTGLLSPGGAQSKAQKTAPVESERQRIQFNFDKVDVAEATSQLLGDYLKLNYVIEPTLQGRISMFLEGEFSKDELFQMISKAYEANNISIVPRKGIYYIQTLQRSASSGLPVADSLVLKPDKDGVKPVIVIYRLRYLDAKQALNTIKFFLSPGRPITTDQLSNTIIFVENNDNAQSIVEVLRTLDINILQEVSMEIVPVKSISPQDAVQSMEALMAKLGIFKDSNIKGNLAFIPLMNFGGVLVLTQNPDLMKTAKQWISALDVHGTEVGEQIYVYFAQNGLSKDIGDILTQIYGLKSSEKRPEEQIVQSSRQGFGSKSGGTSGFGSSSGSGLGSSSSFGSSSSSRFGSGSSGASGQGWTSASGTAAQAAQRSARTSIRGAQGLAPAKTLTGEVVIIPDEVNNAIVVRANANDYAKIKKTIESLDILPRAVLIEVMIAEVTLTKDLAYGLKWYFSHAPVNAGFMQGSQNGLAGTTVDVGTASATGGVALAWISNAKDIAALLTFLSNKTDVRVLATPTLLATDNKEAAIQVGGLEPVPTGSYSGGTSTTVTDVFSTIEYEETGVILNVTPHINAGGLVRLEVDQTIRRVGASVTVGVGNTAPTFTERNLKTTLLAQNGSTVVIGGIIQESVTETREGIPFLIDMPILSPLFGNKEKKRERTELIIAITPRVVDHRSSDATREFMNKLRDLRELIPR